MLKPMSVLLLSAFLASTAIAEEVKKVPAEAAQPVAAMDSEAAAKQASVKNMLHANPLPNYMAILRKDAAALQLTAEQQAKLDAWYQEHNAHANETVKKIVAAEQALAQASMDGTSSEVIMKQYDEMAAMRRALAEGKTQCRDHVRSVLSAEQWAQLTKLQSEMLAVK